MPTLFTPAFVRWLNTKAFSEADHPRGQPENAGQFAPSEGASEAVDKAREATGSTRPDKPARDEVPVDYEAWEAEHTIAAADESYRKAGKEVDGRKVLSKVHNVSSINSSIEDPETLPGIREIPLDAFQSIRERRKQGKGEVGRRTSADDERRVEELAANIKENKKISPLIVVDDGDPEGPYVLEGGHRLDALERIGAESLPALVVLDLNAIGRRIHKDGKLSRRLIGDSA